MLTQIKLFPTLLILLMANCIWASQGENVQFTVVNTSSFVITLEDASTEKIELSIRDINDQVFHSETISEEQLTNKQYNLKELPDGAYSVVMTYDQYITVQPLLKENNSIIFDTDSSQKIYRPTFSDKLGYLDLAILCSPSAAYNILIQDDLGNILFNETIDSAATINKRFNLTKLEEGKYDIMVGIEDINFNEYFSKTIHINPTLALK